MATRRPKVPRAAAAAPKSSATGRVEADGGDLIRADFGGPWHGTEPAGHAPARNAGAAAPDAPGAGKSSPAGHSAAPAKTGSGKTGARGDSPASPAAGGGAGQKTGHSGQTEALDPVPAKAFSGRLLALGVVMIAITIMLAPTVRIFLEKRAEIAALQADISAQQAKQADLKREVSRWHDPNYVKQQARDRINMVMPGETGYWVYGSDLPVATSGAGAAAGTATDPANLPWVDSLWESIRRSATD